MRSKRVRFEHEAHQLCWCTCSAARGVGLLGVEAFERQSSDPIWDEILEWTRNTWDVLYVMKS